MTYLSRLFEEQNMNENRFYVYLHKIKETGEVFYVGKGTSDRLISRTGRSQRWREITSKNEWVAEKYINNLTEEDAKEKELELILNLNPEANVHRTKLDNRKLDIEYLRQKYAYSEESPSGLIYNEWNSQYGSKRKEKGDVAGYYCKDGYFTVFCKGVGNLLAHRVVWAIVNSEDPGEMKIDHIDGCRSNNKISNLRKVTVLENNQNRKPRIDTKTGIVGVHFEKNGYYCATWRDENSNYLRMRVSVAKYGDELAFALACYYRSYMISSKQSMTDRHKGSIDNSWIVSKYSHEEIMDMIHCKSGTNNESDGIAIYRIKDGNRLYWQLIRKDCSMKFSIFKYGEEVAKGLVVEIRNRLIGQPPKEVIGLSLEETNKIIFKREITMSKISAGMV